VRSIKGPVANVTSTYFRVLPSFVLCHLLGFDYWMKCGVIL
jgi:hypothetical protein